MATTTPSRTGVSPTSSPRLPSPPPFTEVQFGPKSPLSGVSEFDLEKTAKHDESASRRVRRGSKAVDMAKGPPFVPLHQLESPFQLQEYLKSLYHSRTHNDDSNMTRPITKEMALELATPPTAQDTGETIDRNLWLYELCRLLCSKTTRIIVAFFADNPPCSSATCPEMRASEWQYLCAVHEPPKSCCAIDYCNHTLDWASNVLTSTKHFPSRLSLGGEGGNVYQSMRQLTNIFRRVYRIYAHAWFQHREVFWAIEAELGLYLFFKTVCDVYQLIPEDNYTIPPEAEGEREEALQTPVNTSSPQKVTVLQKPDDQQSQESAPDTSSLLSVTGTTYRRHKHTPSTGVPVTVIAEGAEEDDDLSRSRTLEAHTSSPPKILPDIERTSTPNHIDLPATTDPERAPEDPTPIATHDTNPFGSPSGPTIVEGEDDGETTQFLSEGASQADTLSTPARVLDYATPEGDKMTSDASEPNMQGTSSTSTSLKEDQVATEGEADEENETMERIQVTGTIKSDSSTTSTKDAVSAADDEAKGGEKPISTD